MWRINANVRNSSQPVISTVQVWRILRLLGSYLLLCTSIFFETGLLQSLRHRYQDAAEREREREMQLSPLARWTTI